MKKWLIFLFVFSLGMLFACQKEQGTEGGIDQLSQVSFEQVQRDVTRYYAENKLEECSDRLVGTRVRWSGKIMILTKDGTVRVVMGNSPSPNGEFKVSEKMVKRFRTSQTISFTGTIESIEVLETFPPMPKAFVRFKQVLVE